MAENPSEEVLIGRRQEKDSTIGGFLSRRLNKIESKGGSEEQYNGILEMLKKNNIPRIAESRIGSRKKTKANHLNFPEEEPVPVSSNPLVKLQKRSGSKEDSEDRHALITKFKLPSINLEDLRTSTEREQPATAEKVKKWISGKGIKFRSPDVSHSQVFKANTKGEKTDTFSFSQGSRCVIQSILGSLPHLK